MNSSHFNIWFGTACLVLFAAFYIWESSGTASKLAPVEIDRYMAKLETLPMPAEEKASAMARIRAWAEADDGRSFYMLNLMRYYPELRHARGWPEYKGTPREANAYYESVALKLVLKTGSYPLMGGDTLGPDVLDAPAQLNNWSRVLVMRYRNRRAFLELLTDPAYAPVMPYKLMALSVVLVPVSGELVIPDARLLVGAALLVVFLAVGWRRATRR